MDYGKQFTVWYGDFKSEIISNNESGSNWFYVGTTFISRELL